jgi:F420-non-reducing hydrogenase large subunit
LGAAPEVARRVVHVRTMCAKCWRSSPANPSTRRPRFRAASASHWRRTSANTLRKMADETLELAKFSIAFAKENVFPKYLDVVKSLGVITTGFIGTVKENRRAQPL